MQYLRHIFFSLIISLSCCTADCQQPKFSLGMDGGILRSFKKGQQFWALGQTIAAHFSLTPKNGVYVFFNYHINGRFRNNLNVTAKSSATIPQEIAYINKVKIGFTHISMGWKYYLLGAFDRDTKQNLYAYGGLGLMMGRVENSNNISIDTAEYTFPVQPGEGKFKRLTADLGIGYEIPIGGDLFIYMEGRTLIPITNYPSPYLFVNNYAPINASVFLGIRMLFD